MKTSIRVTSEGIELLILEPSHLNDLTLDLTVLNPTKVYCGVVYAFTMTQSHSATDMVVPGSLNAVTHAISDGSKKVGLPAGLSTNDLGSLSGSFLADLNRNRYAGALEQSFLDKISKAFDALSQFENSEDANSIFLKQMAEEKPYVAASYLWYPLNVAVRNFKASGFYSTLVGDDKLFMDNFLSKKSTYLTANAAMALVKSALTGDKTLDTALVNAGKIFLNDIDYMAVIGGDGSRWINV